ncbi:MAG: efflux transporter outer membrane subunit [Verrucomicrobiales bacterium]
MTETRTGFSPRLLREASGLAALVGALFLAGCAWNDLSVGNPGALVGELPERWTGGSQAIPGAAATGWLDDFGNPKLRDLVDEAVESNYDLSASIARVFQARERAEIAGADRLPTLDAGLRTSRSQNLRGASFQTVRSNSFNFSLDFAWEVDLWGRIKNLRDAEIDRFRAEANFYESSRLSLAANVAKTAFEIVESRQQIALARRTLASLRTNLEILDAKLEAGDADDRTPLDISLSRADIARAQSNILVEQRQLDASKRTLETLLGRYPSGTVEAISSLPQISRNVPAGLPSELLLRRPDLLASESQVDAALKELVASRKALLPSIAITASGGTATTEDFGDLFNIQNLVWNIGQNLTQPLYRGGRLRAEVRLDEHERKELVSTYADTALEAFREVETALAAERYLVGQVEALSTAVEEARRAEDLSLSQYEEGLVEILTLLESQRRAFESESALLAVKLQLLSNRVDLYLALGGDFDHPLVTK